MLCAFAFAELFSDDSDSVVIFKILVPQQCKVAVGDMRERPPAVLLSILLRDFIVIFFWFEQLH